MSFTCTTCGRETSTIYPDDGFICWSCKQKSATPVKACEHNFQFTRTKTGKRSIRCTTCGFSPTTDIRKSHSRHARNQRIRRMH